MPPKTRSKTGSTADGGAAHEEIPEEYAAQVKAQYRNEMEELYFRCYRSAQMNYYLGSWYDKAAQILEYIAVILLIIGAGLNCWEKWTSGIITCLVGTIFEVAARVNTDLILSIGKRGRTHVEIATGWQLLEWRTQSCLIKMDNLNVPFSQYSKWLNSFHKQRCDLAAKASIPQATYNYYMDPKKIIDHVKSRRERFRQFQDLKSEL